MIPSNPDYKIAVQLLYAIPSVKHDSAVTIICEIGIDMSQFCNSKHLYCWAVLTPGSNKASSKKKTIRITLPASPSNLHWFNVPMQP